MKYLNPSFSVAMGHPHRWPEGSNPKCLDCGVSWRKIQTARGCELEKLQVCQDSSARGSSSEDPARS